MEKIAGIMQLWRTQGMQRNTVSGSVWSVAIIPDGIMLSVKGNAAIYHYLRL
jgi:hypothetical protein